MTDRPEARFCGECGVAADPEATFCSACGTELATFEAPVADESSHPSNATSSTQTPKPTTSIRQRRWPFSRRITTLLVLLIVSAAVISLAISLSSITFATNFNIGVGDTAGRFSGPLAGGRVINKDADQRGSDKYLSHSGSPTHHHITKKRDHRTVRVKYASKYKRWPSHHRHGQFHLRSSRH